MFRTRKMKKKISKILPTDFVTCVPWAQIEQRWGKREYKNFLKWMAGQTCLPEGAYIGDINSYAEQRNRGRKVKDLICYD